MIPSKLIVINWAIVEKMELCALVNHRHVCLCCLNVPIRYESRTFLTVFQAKVNIYSQIDPLLYCQVLSITHFVCMGQNPYPGVVTRLGHANG